MPSQAALTGLNRILRLTSVLQRLSRQGVPIGHGPAKAPWAVELDRRAMRLHTLGAWVAAIANMAFVLNDMVVAPDHWQRFGTVRALVAVCILLGLFVRRRFGLGPAILLFIPYVLISAQNAYMWSYMDADTFRDHTLAYATLFLGGSMIALWTVRWSVLVLLVSVVANVWFLSAQSELPFGEIMANGGNLMVTVALIATLMVHNRYQVSKRELILREQLEKATVEAREQRAVIEAAHQDLTASIRYSQRIQQAVLPKVDAMAGHVAEHFVLHRPKDIVSGDFHWCAHFEGRTVIAAADCTGHGVPGALMSILGSTLLKKVVVVERELRPAAILDRLREEVIAALNQQQQEGPKDGMDIALCVVDHAKGLVQYAGANNPLYRVRNGELTELRADRMPVGQHFVEAPPFKEHALETMPGDMFYLCSDGYQDQFGGTDGRKFGRARMRDLLAQVAQLPAGEQQRRLTQALELWQHDRPAVDDVLVLGFRL